MASEPDSKSGLRSLIRTRIASLPTSHRAAADRRVCGFLGQAANKFAAHFVLGYVGLSDEVRIDQFLAAMVAAGRRVFLPRVVDGGLRVAPWVPHTELIRDDQGVVAPATQHLDRLPSAPGLVVVPGRAFDSAGQRLGRGGGYYDQFLAKLGHSVGVVGVAYECQMVASVPCESHDRSVDWLITEAGLRSASVE